MIRISDQISIDDCDLQEQFVRASGPGGQNVNKVATAVELRFDVRGSGLPLPLRLRLEGLAGRRLNKDGVLVIRAERFRTREQNRKDARERLAALVEKAARPPKPRIKTGPSRAARERRLDQKARRSAVKRQRHTKPVLE